MKGPYTHTHTRTHTCTHAHTRTHTYTHTHAHTQAHIPDLHFLARSLDSLTKSILGQARRQGGSGDSDEPPIVLGTCKHKKPLSAFNMHILHGPHSQNSGVIYSLAYQQSCNQPLCQPAWELHCPSG